MAKRFKSYLNNFEMKEKGKAEEVEKSASTFFGNLLEPYKLPGEFKVAEADNVLLFAPFSNRKQGISGHLFVTNFKISFVTADKSSYPDANSSRSHSISQRNKLIDNTDIPLTNIESIYQVSSGGKKKRLLPGMAVTNTTKQLEIHCKDFQIHVFGFKFTPKDQNKKMTNTVVVYSFPGNESLLFANEFGQIHNQEKEVMTPEFFEREHWERELERLQCQTMWRVSDANVGFKMSTSLPEYFVTPIKLLNADLLKAVDQYPESRVPTWSYTYVNGASLMRTSYILPVSDSKIFEERIMSAVQLASGNAKEPYTVDLARRCPSLVDIRDSLYRLKAGVMTDSVKDWGTGDGHWLSDLEGSQWLQHVADCMNTANHVLNQMIRDSQTVVLKEETGTDFSAVVSCLVQLQLDPEYRSITGFQSLVQREWVVMGHQFQRRMRLIHSSHEGGEEAPVFLLFLDCVWQLLQQFPSSFAFTETYLTSLWDSIHLGIFDTFLFNSCWHRMKFLSEGQKRASVSLPSAWDWKFHLSDEQTLLFNNPLYKLRNSFDLDSVVNSARTTLRLSGEHLQENQYPMLLGAPPPSTDMFALQETILKPEVTAVLLKFWAQCYLRWIVPAQIVGGGNPSQYMQQCILTEEVICLQHKLVQLASQEQNPSDKQNSVSLRTNASLVQSRERSTRPPSGLVFGAQNTSQELSSMFITSSFPFSPGISPSARHSFICGPLSKYLQETEIEHDYDQDIDD